MPEASDVSGRQSQVVPDSLVPHSYSRKLTDHQPLNTRVSRARRGAGAVVSLWDFSLWNVGFRNKGPRGQTTFDPSEWPGKIWFYLHLRIVSNTTKTVCWGPLLNNRGLCLENTMFWNMIMCVYILPDCILPWEQWKCHFYLTELFAFRLETVHQAVPPPSPNLLGFFVFLVSGNLRARMMAPLTASGWGLAVN